MPPPERDIRPRGATPPAVIRGGTVVDQTGTRRADVFVRDGVVASIAERIGGTGPGTIVLDASGCVVAPGFDFTDFTLLRA